MKSYDIEWLVQRLDKLDSKQDLLRERQEELNSILVENTSNLKEHMRRTALLEAEIKPIKGHVILMNNIAKICSVFMATVLAAHSLGLI